MCLPSDALAAPYHLTWVFTLGWGISSRLLQQRTAASPYLGWGYLLTAAVPDLQCAIAHLGPPVPAQPLCLLSLLFQATGPGWLMGGSSQRHSLASGLGGPQVTPGLQEPDFRSGCLLPAATGPGRWAAPLPPDLTCVLLLAG